MKINAVSVVSTDLKKTVEFYSLLGFKFGAEQESEDHLEPETSPGSARLMVDSEALITKIYSQKPKPATQSSFAIEYDTPAEVDEVAERVKRAGFTVVKKPWDAFWGQRYCIVEDPDGYKCDLYASLPTN